MKTVAKLGIAFCLTAALGLAETWTGKLIDANCKPSNDSNSKESVAACAPTQATTVFSIQTSDGKVYRLDASGNAKAVAAMKNDPSKTAVSVSGDLEGQMVKVQTIDLR